MRLASENFKTVKDPKNEEDYEQTIDLSYHISGPGNANSKII